MRGRNADRAEKAVREATSLSANAALQEHVVDFVARDPVEFCSREQDSGDLYIYTHSDFPASGGLMAYAADLDGLFARAGFYVAEILKGARPADMPVEQPEKFRLIINLNTAKALGLTIPPSLIRAEVIE